MSQVTELTLADFEARVLQSPLTTLVEFRTAWCPPCRQFAPTLDQLAAQYAGSLNVFTVDIEQSPALAKNFNIQAVPLFLVYHHGQLTHRIQGLPAKRLLLEKLNLPTTPPPPLPA